MRRALFSLVLFAIGIGLLVASSAQSKPSAPSRNDGTFNVSVFTAGLPTHFDPALSYEFPGWALLDATCPRLMKYPDKPPPEGLRIVPEVAASYPRVSSDATTFTFMLRTGFRFSDGKPVRADAFARAISRTLAPGIESPGSLYTQDIVGASAVRAGRRASPAGVVAKGNRLVVRFVRPVPDFPARTTMPFFCAVPPTLPSHPEGDENFPGAGPYYVSEYVRGKRIVLKRNRFYGGTRPHHVDRFVFDFQAGTPGEVLDLIETGRADWGWVPPPVYADPNRGLARKYGVNRSQFFVTPGLALMGYQLNSYRALFRNNAKLRRAVNFAVDRRALVRGMSGRATDQYLPPGIPGFRDARIYPLAGPNVRRAQALARGHIRSGKAVMFTIDVPAELARAQILKRNLKAIGLDVEVKAFPGPAFFRMLSMRDARFDIAPFGWAPDYIDPYQYTNALFDSRIGGGTLTRFHSPRFNRLLRRTARRQGKARYRAYGKLDVTLARDAAPMVAVAYQNDLTFVSKRVGCIVLRPTLDLTAACLK